MVNREDLLKSLAEQNVTYELIEHVPVYTIEEMDALGLSRHGVIAKNLFLRDAKGKRHFLVILRGSRSVDMKALQPLLESSRLSFASEDRLKKYLNLERGSVTPFGLLNDAGHVVEVFIDKGLEGAPAVGFHPNENTATVFLPMAEVIRIIQEHGNPIKFIDL
ncbi:MAG: prolyl-tRNA synthetase associated domain-containing protein [Oscillospiraceae bacterium]|nr:prolyl-tRNA synthetase associated domain-containing protein [Oscillospiraceae bacterium]MCI9363666.1 prolyl-tRNA synthetase associated domain-containing protein [Oscillospiraceae bacterium]MCI9669277.1 prolyl-tRNA synthetase associated domain-containing protein [Oscillospiraceae bacterium]